jgi:hypothetical protein
MQKLASRLQQVLRLCCAPAVRLPVQILVLVAAFAGASALAGLLGAANLGTALAFGQIAFVIALVAVMLRT